MKAPSRNRDTKVNIVGHSRAARTIIGIRLVTMVQPRAARMASGEKE